MERGGWPVEAAIKNPASYKLKMVNSIFCEEALFYRKMSFDYESTNLRVTTPVIRIQLRGNGEKFPSAKFDTDKTSVISMGITTNKERTNLIHYIDVRGSSVDVNNIYNNLDAAIKQRILSLSIKE